MKIASKLATLVAVTALAVGALAAPAHAGPGDTTATFTITAGALAITVPASATLGTVATGAGTTSGTLGAVTVADTRGALVNSWTTTVSSTTFVLPGTPSANETVAVNQIAYLSGAFTAHTGLGVFVPGVLANGGVPGTAGSYTGAAGNSSTTWNPTLTLTLLSSQVAGTYTGTVTHSVA
ncbi:hypothetical protein BH20ACT2_BH20ACT2_04470 [soil metagenome]